MKNKKLCKYLIERILHIQIKDIRYLISERHINSARIGSKSIRLDVYVENQEGTVLDIEMQVTGDNSTVYFDKYVNSGKTRSEFTQALDAETKRVTNDEEWRERYK